MAEERKRNELEAAVLAFRDAEPEERTAMNAALTRTEAGILDGIAHEAAGAALLEGRATGAGGGRRARRRSRADPLRARRPRLRRRLARLARHDRPAHASPRERAQARPRCRPDLRGGG